MPYINGRSICDQCGAVALYKVGRVLFCKKHKADATQRRTYYAHMVDSEQLDRPNVTPRALKNVWKKSREQSVKVKA